MELCFIFVFQRIRLADRDGDGKATLAEFASMAQGLTVVTGSEGSTLALLEELDE